MPVDFKIFKPLSDEDFLSRSLGIFRNQARNVPEYKKFLEYLNINPESVNSLEEIPFLPIELFRDQSIIHDGFVPEITFVSSGTTGIKNSRHLVADASLYKNSLLNSFRFFYGNPEDYCILALLPNYLERKGSSLIYMVEYLISKTGHPESGFYLYDYEALVDKVNIIKSQGSGKKILLIGVSFALLDLAEKYSPDFSGLIVMETGGMKGRRKEILRSELHRILKDKLNVTVIHSEYGMTELLSQAYSVSDGIFQSPPWMKIMIRDPYDPFTYLKPGQSGAVNIIDLANIYSCSFIASSDVGRIIPGKGFEITGRLDHSDLRGCNLLVS